MTKEHVADETQKGRSLMMHKPNMLLKDDVTEELEWDPQVDNTRIVVAADNGRVTLSGSVPSYFERDRAEADAALVGGVKAIDNQLVVGLVGDAITDDTIMENAIAALDADRLVPHGSVTPGVLEGWVTLIGEVRHHYQRQAAERATGRVDGVLGIENQITLTSSPIPSDVADRISKAFQRNAIFDDSQIKVSNIGDTIYLDGTAGSWLARQKAEDAAWQAPGVNEVVDRLGVAA
jgi:osmotically-inducible protein OsmY